MYLEYVVPIIVLVWIALEWLSFRKLDRQIRDLNLTVGYNIYFLAYKYDDYGKATPEKET